MILKSFQRMLTISKKSNRFAQNPIDSQDMSFTLKQVVI